MLGKIIKHEIKLSIQEVGLISIVAVLAGVICPLLWKINSGLIIFFSATLYMLIIAGIALMTMVILYRIFYKSMFDNEGYLTNVIPIKASTLVLGKYISAIILLAITYIALIASLGFLLLISVDFNVLREILIFFSDAFAQLFSADFSFVTVLNIGIYFLVTLLANAAIFFFTSALFNTFKVRKWKFIIIFILYVAISQITGLIAQIPFNIISYNLTMENLVLRINLMFLCSTIINIALTTGVIFLTTYIVDKKVNIQ